MDGYPPALWINPGMPAGLPSWADARISDTPRLAALKPIHRWHQYRQLDQCRPPIRTTLHSHDARPTVDPALIATLPPQALSDDSYPGTGAPSTHFPDSKRRSGPLAHGTPRRSTFLTRRFCGGEGDAALANKEYSIHHRMPLLALIDDQGVIATWEPKPLTTVATKAGIRPDLPPTG